MKMKTHKIIDLFYHEDEHNNVFSGTYQECLNWKSEQGFDYQIVPMTKEEIKYEREIDFENNKDFL